MKITEQQRFEQKIIKGPGPADCWIWGGAIGDDGYGRFWTKAPDGGQKMIRAHRYALAMLHGGLDAITDLEACHVCDNPICVRAEEGPGTHLLLGTRAANMIDRAARGRHNRQLAAQIYGAQSVEERAQRARSLRDLVLAHGYDPQQIQQMLFTVEGQLPLF